MPEDEQSMPHPDEVFRSDADLAAALSMPDDEPGEAKAEPDPDPEPQVTDEPVADQTEPEGDAGHGFDKGLQKLQQDFARERREAREREERLMKMVEDMANRQSAPAPEPEAPSKLDILRDRLQDAIDDPYEAGKLVPELVEEIKRGELERRELSEALKDVREGLAQRDEVIQSVRETQSYQNAEANFKAKHPGLDFRKAYDKVGELVARDYPEWDQIPASAKGTIAGSLIEQVAREMSQAAPDPDADGTEVERKKKAQAGKVIEKGAPPTGKPNRLEMSETEYVNHLFREGTMGKLFGNNTD